MNQSAYQCPLCGQTAERVAATYDRFRLVECPNCDILFQDQTQTVDAQGLVNEVYDERWVASRHQAAMNTFREHASFQTLLLSMFCAKPGDLLEIGSGTGEFLFMAKNAGWNVAGFEPSAAACLYAQERYGIGLVHSLWDSAVIPSGTTFDVVAFWHVLEHIQNPLQFLRETSSLLAPGGTLFCAVPNRYAYTNEVYGAQSPLLTEPDHLVHYSARGLASLLERAGLGVLTLFSREEMSRLQQDLDARRQRAGGAAPSSEAAMALMGKLQSSFRGHELFCVARKLDVA